MHITARITPDGPFWLVYVPEVDRYTQGRNLEDARAMACDLAASMLDVPVGEVELVAVTTVDALD